MIARYGRHSKVGVVLSGGGGRRRFARRHRVAGLGRTIDDLVMPASHEPPAAALGFELIEQPLSHDLGNQALNVGRKQIVGRENLGLQGLVGDRMNAPVVTEVPHPDE